ncbi:MAG TPA: alpha/beta fold hydrolase [Chthoniobacteraceae bacterium]|jgi:triacylglycerol lipase
MQVVAWLSTALALLDVALAGAPPPVSPERNTVLLVHGIYSSSRDLRRLADHLRREGHQVQLIDLNPNCGRAGIDTLARQLASYIEEHVAAPKFDLVGFSMGGLVSRYYVQRLGGLKRVNHLVTLAAPHHGTIMAGFNRLPGVLDMRRDSQLLQDLSRDVDCLQQVRFTSIYTPLDLMIVPAHSSVMPQAENIRIWALMHPSLILEKRCLRAVSAVLRSDGILRKKPAITRAAARRTPKMPHRA